MIYYVYQTYFLTKLILLLQTKHLNFSDKILFISSHYQQKIAKYIIHLKTLLIRRNFSFCNRNQRHDFIHHNKYFSMIINKIQRFLIVIMIKKALKQNKFDNLHDELKFQSSIK
jgi:hypothetical protein